MRDLTSIRRWLNVLVLALLSNWGDEVELIGDVCVKLSGHDPHSMKFHPRYASSMSRADHSDVAQ